MKRLTCLAALVAAAGCGSDRDFSERTYTDVWLQAPNNEVDILWVVDDSCSMAEEQATLANGFVSFVSQMELSGTDFHIGVISTSFDYANPDRGTLIGDPPYLTLDDNYIQEFVQRAQVGVEGADKEKGLEAAAWALSPAMTDGGPNDGFLRNDAQLLMVMVSDEEDCSDRGALEGLPAEDCYREKQNLVPVSEFIDEYRGLKSDPSMVQVGSIVGVDNGACTGTNSPYVTDRYYQVSAFTGGLVGDICQSDWSGMLADLGLTATGIRTGFQTTYLAKPDTLVVTVDGVEIPADAANGYVYDTETWYISFAPSVVPARDAEIVAAYTIQSGGDAPDAVVATGT